MSIGEDTGGSIRVPSSFDNLVGVRVTTGLISRKGLYPLVVFQDTAGPMTRTVKDAAILLDALVGYDPADPFTSVATLARNAGRYAQGLAEGVLSGARIGVLREVFGPDDDPDTGQVNGVIEDAIGAMRDAGAEVVDPVSVPGLQDYIGITSLYLSQSRYDIDGFLSKRPGDHTIEELYSSKRFHPRLDLFIAIAEEAPHNPEEDPNYYRGLAAREQFRRAVLNVMASQNLDALLYPNSQELPPTRKELDDWKWTVLTFPTNALIAAQADLPSISLPAGFAAGNVPVGFELVGKPYGEANLLKLAYAYEREANPRKPPEGVTPLSEESQ